MEFDVGLFAGILPVFGHFGAGNFPHPNFGVASYRSYLSSRAIFRLGLQRLDFRQLRHNITVRTASKMSQPLRRRPIPLPAMTTEQHLPTNPPHGSSPSLQQWSHSVYFATVTQEA